MPTYRVPVLIKGFAVVKYPDGKAAGDYVGGLPRDAEAEVSANVPYLCGARMVDFTIELDGQAQAVERAG
jgi:hypothetical protein